MYYSWRSYHIIYFFYLLFFYSLSIYLSIYLSLFATQSFSPSFPLSLSLFVLFNFIASSLSVVKLSKVGVIAYLSLKTPTELKSLAEAYVKNSDALASRCIIIPNHTIPYQWLLTAILSARLFYTVKSAFTFSFLSLPLLLS